MEVEKEGKREKMGEKRSKRKVDEKEIRGRSRNGRK